MENKSFFEISRAKRLIILPIILMIFFAYVLIKSIINSGKPISYSVNIFCLVFLLLLIFGCVLLALHILTSKLSVQGSQITVKQLFSQELKFDVHEINQVIKDVNRGGVYYKIILHGISVFAFNYTYRNYKLLLEYFKNHKVYFINNNS